MRLSDLISSSSESLRRNGSRSLLTMLGIVIGVGAVILMLSLGHGAQAYILAQVEGLGAQTIAVIPGRAPSGPSDVSALYADSLKRKDLTALRNSSNVPDLRQVMPVVFGAEPVVRGSETYQVSLFGATDRIADMFDLHPSGGQFFDESDVTGRSAVVVIGSKVADHLFENLDPVGQNVSVKGRHFRVIAVLPPSGGGTLFNFDDMIILPYTTAQDYLLGIKYFNRLIIEANPDADVGLVADDVRATLRDSHNISDPAKDDFFVQTQADLVSRLSTITDALTYFLAAVTSLALFVGGIGIMNMMLVSVTERTREIGLRKSIGATKEEVMHQFLLEAVILTLFGGLIGIACGIASAYGLSWLVHRSVPEWRFIMPYDGIVLSVAVSSVVGIVFGYYPARRAARLDPIEALRYE